jgi:hypothetical protein
LVGAFVGEPPQPLSHGEPASIVANIIARIIARILNRKAHLTLAE